MIDDTYAITLNGVNYRLGHSEQGDHYEHAAETLRPPNAVVVQGEGSNQKFQVRPDVLLWHWTDWSSGEGANKYDFQDTARANELTGARVFIEPGNLTPGYYIEDTAQPGGGDLVKSVVLIKGIGALYAMDTNAVDGWIWNITDSDWDDITFSVPSVGVEGQGCGDSGFIYFVERSTRKTYKWGGSGAAVEINDAGTYAGSQYLAEQATNIYNYSPLNGKILEIPKSGAASTDLTAGGLIGLAGDGGHIAEMNGKVYFMVARKERTRIMETVPSTAAGEGYVSILSTLEGFQGESMWTHQGTIYVMGQQEASSPTTRAILYLTPGGDWGSIGAIRTGDALGVAVGEVGANDMLQHYFVASQRSGSEAGHALFQVDGISGGIAMLGYDEDGDATAESVGSLQAWNGDIFWSTVQGASTKRTLRAYTGGFHQSVEAISPWHDFDLADEKILSSLVTSFSALPADWTVNVDYALNGVTSWTTAVTDAVDNSVGGRTAISTDSSTVKFRRVRFRVRMTYTGAGAPTSAPSFYGLEIRAQVAKPQHVWILLLDLGDEHSAGASSKVGAQRIVDIKTAVATEAVVAFIDGYENRHTGQTIEYDVVIDSFRMVLERPGEGTALVRLREVP